MVCHQIRAAFRRGDVPSGAEVKLHLRHCEDCAELFTGGAAAGRALAQLGSDDTRELARLREALSRTLTQEKGARAWLRSRPTRLRVGLVIGAVGLMVGVIGTVGLRPDFWFYSRARFWTYALLLAAAIAFSVHQVVLSHLASWRRLALGCALLALTLVLAVLPIAHGAHPASLRGVDEAFWPRAAGCFVYGSIFSATALWLLWLVDRNDRLSAMAAAFTATSAGLVGNLALHLHCAVTHPQHLVVGHFGMLIVVVLSHAAFRRLQGALEDGRRPRIHTGSLR